MEIGRMRKEEGTGAGCRGHILVKGLGDKHGKYGRKRRWMGGGEAENRGKSENWLAKGPTKRP